MKPVRIFLFFAAVLALLWVIALMVPEEGISLGSEIRLHFVSLTELFKEDTLHRDANVARLLAHSSVTEDPESEPEEGLFLLPDTSVEERKPEVIPVNTDSLQKSVYRLAFPSEGEGMLDPFFKKLEGLRDGTTDRTRILHFGDSQIENDRMTALIRFRLQHHFGGTGTGLVPAVPLYGGHMAYRQKERGRWIRYTFFGNRDTAILHRCYGVMGTFAAVPGSRYGEWPMLDFRFNTSRRTGRFDRVKIYLHSYIDHASIAFRVNDTISDTIRNIIDGFSVAEYDPGIPVRDLRISMGLPEGGRIYGISFESERGIQVDNIAMRGGSGLIFSKMDRKLQKAIFDDLSPGLILLQFGGNVVPYIDADYYRRAFRRELKFLEELCPGIPIIVIGPSDMSFKEKDSFKTYPAVEPVRDALRSSALESGCAFWDLYEAMGGYNSMPSFVHADPPLASSDYVHFTPLGVNLVAEMLYNALMLEYTRYTNKERQP